jgi:uncharacterized membrane protein
MKYTEINNNYNEQVLQGPYEELNVPIQPEEETFLKKHIIYKLFFIFIIGSIFGCYMEQIQYYLHKGIWECRAGVVWGPFSEIYGLGAMIMFLLSCILRERSPLLIFSAATICGSAFEYIARLFQEIAFGSITWDYSKQPLNICGRTSLKYGIYWGLLGLVFIKWIFPLLNQWLEHIRGKAAFVFTWVFILFMTVNLIFSAAAVNRWSERLEGIPAKDTTEEYMDKHYDNDLMKSRFPHMKFIDTSDKAA